MKTLLILIRKDKEVLEEERNEFIDAGGLDPTATDTWDIFDNTLPLESLPKYDLVIVGGTSDDKTGAVQLEDDFPFLHAFEQAIKTCIHEKIPTFASCGGFMLIAHVLGGKIDLMDKVEIGAIEVSLTKEAHDDRLFFDFPPSFYVIAGHGKQVTDLPTNAILLGSSQACQVQAFTFPDAPLYAFQFHPEITGENFSKRVDPYWHKYYGTREDYEISRKGLSETGVSNQILKKFIERVVPKHSQG